MKGEREEIYSNRVNGGTIEWVEIYTGKMGRERGQKWEEIVIRQIAEEQVEEDMQYKGERKKERDRQIEREHIDRREERKKKGKKIKMIVTEKEQRNGIKRTEKEKQTGSVGRRGIQKDGHVVLTIFIRLAATSRTLPDGKRCG